jgi:hypothetical protein
LIFLLASLFVTSGRGSELILGFWLKERYSLVHCEQQEKLVERYMSALQEWAYFAYPQNKASCGMSERQLEEHARKAKAKMKEIQELMQQHRNGCDICKGVVMAQSTSLGVER